MIYRLLLLFFFASSAYAQQYNFINYTVENGLAQNQVLAMVQDKQGYLWFGTTGGLSRFDGKSFVNFSQRDSLYRNQVNDLFIDNNGTLWIATIGGVSYYNGQTFHSLSFGAQYDAIKINSIEQALNGDMWFATDAFGIVVYDGKEMNVISEIQGLNNDKVRSLYLDDEGTMWIATKEGVNYFKDGGIYNYDHPSIDGVSISAVSGGHEGSVWVSTFGAGAFNIDGNKIVGVNNTDGLISDWVRQSFATKDMTTWFVTRFGISEFGRQGLIETYNDKNGLGFPDVRCVMQDNDGNIWIGTSGQGIMKFSGKAFVNYTSEDGIVDNIILSIQEDGDGSLWLGSYSSGAVKFKDGENSVINDSTGLSNNRVWSILIDKSGRKWFGTALGLTLIDGDSSRSFYPSSEDDDLDDGKITAIYEDSKNTIWFGSRLGISKYLGNGKFKNYSYTEGFKGSNIRTIKEDEDGNLWCGADNGLFFFNPITETTTEYTVATELKETKVLCIEIDQNNTLWCGTDNGLYKQTSNSFEYVPIGSDARTNFINFLLSDAKNGLWIGTNYGIYYLSTKEGKQNLRSFTNHEGIKNLECNLNAAFRDSKGYYWFGTAGGLVRLDKSYIRYGSNLKQKISLRNIQLFNEDTDWASITQVDSKTKLPKNLSLSHNKNTLTFQYILFNYSNPEGVVYQYMLENFDETWSPMTKDLSATYRKLPPGDYTFKVRARTSTGEWTEPTLFSFSIKPPFWQTLWFFVLCAIAVFCLGIAIHIWRKSINKRKRETEQLKYRNKLLALEHQSLNASLNRHFIFNALNSIQYYINRQDRISANKYLSSFAKLIRKNLDSSASGSNYVSLAEEMERIELYLSLEQMRFANKFEYEIVYKQDIDAESIMVPSMLLQPFIENSIWHGVLPMEKSGKISLIMDKMINGDIKFEIIDNGIGVDVSRQAKIDKGDTHNSQGMRITSGRIDLLKTITRKNISLKGPFQIYDDEGNVIGTKVEIILPSSTIETILS